MAKKTLELNTPFRKGEAVLATRDLEEVPGGTQGTIQLQNGIGVWKRYWVMFDGGRQMGQVDHNDLVRPFQLQQWIDAKQEAEAAALRAKTEAEAPAEVAAGGGGGGIASQIPADLLERSRAAKARLLG